MANPMYRQIAEDLGDRIDSGQLKPGQQLPTELELRDQYGASRNTVRDAIRWLMTRGLVETKPGQGTFVTKKIDPYVTTLTADPKVGPGETVALVDDDAMYKSDVEGQKRTPHNAEPQVEIQKAAGPVPGLLQLPEGSQVISRHQKRFIDGTPWSLQTSFYPRGFAAQGAERLSDAGDIEGGTVKYLADTLGLRQVAYRDWITVRAPDETEVKFFNLPPDGRVGVFEIFRTAFDQSGTPMRLTVTVFPADRNQFIVNVGETPKPRSQDDQT